ncbi:hypothetical protein JN06_00121 [Bacteroides zoogleoformans]|nr:hypothetical protein JN06_00121 [Bacteroides zoogleoformans]
MRNYSFLNFREFAVRYTDKDLLFYFFLLYTVQYIQESRIVLVYDVSIFNRKYILFVFNNDITRSRIAGSDYRHFFRHGKLRFKHIFPSCSPIKDIFLKNFLISFLRMVFSW